MQPRADTSHGPAVVRVPDRCGRGSWPLLGRGLRRGDVTVPRVCGVGCSRLLAPLTGLEPVHTAPEADALSAELQGLGRVRLPRPQEAPIAAKGLQLALAGPTGTTAADRGASWSPPIRSSSSRPVGTQCRNSEDKVGTPSGSGVGCPAGAQRKDLASRRREGWSIQRGPTPQPI